MIAIPTIDLQKGTCVKPPGSPLRAPVPDAPIGDVIGVARTWASNGFCRLQIIDRDAESGFGSNAGLIADVIREDTVEIQVAGGIRTLEQIEQLADAGASRVVLDPHTLDELDWLADAADLFPGLLVVSTDVRERRMVTRGWVRGLPLDILDLVSNLTGIPLGGLLVASAYLDGRHTLADLSLLEDVAEACDVPVMCAGGVATMDDLRALEHRGVAGAVLGSVFHSGALDPRAVAQAFGS